MSDAVMEAVAAERAPWPRWDYRVVEIHARHADALEEELRELGANGWELSLIGEPVPNTYRWVFRRPAAS